MVSGYKTKSRKETREQIDVGENGPNKVMGSAIETLTMGEWDEALRAAGSTLRIVPGPDFVNGDFAVVDLEQAGVSYPFPEDVPFSSYERLRWAHHHRETVQCVLGDVKTGPPDASYLRNDVEVFFIRLASMPSDRLYAVPKDRVTFMYDQMWSRRRIDGHGEMLFSRPALAPYAVFEEEYVALFERLMYGRSSGNARTFRSPVLAAGPDVFAAAGCSTVELGNLFRFNSASHEYSFRCLWKLYETLCDAQSGLRFKRVMTQPMGGDFLVECDGQQFVGQHKAVVTEAGPEWWEPPSHFHFLFVHCSKIAYGLEGVLRVYCDPDTHEEFAYDTAGMRALESFIRSRKADANRRLHAASVSLVSVTSDQEEPVHEHPRDGPQTYSTFRKRAHKLALQLCKVINEDTEECDLPLAALYLNWDQTHVYGEVFVGRHEWTADERSRVRQTGMLPASLEHAAYLSERRKGGIVLRCCCREHRGRGLSSAHFPLQQRGAELPVTSQKFICICAPDGTSLDTVPSSLLMLPSEFIDFPETVYEEWERSRIDLENQEAKLFTLDFLYGHAVMEANPLRDGYKPNVRLADFWITPRSVVQHLDRMLQDVGTMSIVHAESRVPATEFQTGDYLTEAHDVLCAPLNFGMILKKSEHHYRTTGFFGEEQERQRAAREQKREMELLIGDATPRHDEHEGRSGHDADD